MCIQLKRVAWAEQIRIFYDYLLTKAVAYTLQNKANHLMINIMIDGLCTDVILFVKRVFEILALSNILGLWGKERKEIRRLSCIPLVNFKINLSLQEKNLPPFIRSWYYLLITSLLSSNKCNTK